MDRNENSMEVENPGFSPDPLFGPALCNMNTTITATSECMQLQEAYSAVDGLSPLPSYLKSAAHIVSATWIILEDSSCSFTVDCEEASSRIFDGCLKAISDVLTSIKEGA